MNGEFNEVFTQEGSQKVKWTPAKNGTSVTWYKVSMLEKKNIADC